MGLNDDKPDPWFHMGRARLVRDAIVGRSRRVIAQKGTELTMMRKSAIRGRPDCGVVHQSPDLGEDSYFTFSRSHFEWLPGCEPQPK